MNPRLETRRSGSDPVCANCRHWAARDEQRPVHSAMCEPKQIVTLDLAVCAGWELHEVHTGRILKPDEEIDAA